MMRALLVGLALLPAVLSGQTFTVGARVHVNAGVCARPDTLVVGTGCGTGGVLRAVNDKGTLVRGPAGSTTPFGVSWYVHYDVPPDGWSTAKYLTVDSVVVPPPPPPPVVRVASVSVSPISATLELLAGSLQAFAVAKDSTGASLARPITWTSQDTTVATVDPVGVIRPVRVGVTTIVATSEGKSAGLPVTVTPARVPPPGPVAWSIRDSVLLTAPLFLKPPCLLVLTDGVTTTCGPYPVGATGTGLVTHHVTITVTVSP